MKRTCAQKNQPAEGWILFISLSSYAPKTNPHFRRVRRSPRRKMCAGREPMGISIAPAKNMSRFLKWINHQNLSLLRYMEPPSPHGAERGLGHRKLLTRSRWFVRRELPGPESLGCRRLRLPFRCRRTSPSRQCSENCTAPTWSLRPIKRGRVILEHALLSCLPTPRETSTTRRTYSLR